MLPRNLRAKIWRHYQPGQEISGKPSLDYIAVAILVQKWIASAEGVASPLAKVAKLAEQEARLHPEDYRWRNVLADLRALTKETQED